MAGKSNLSTRFCVVWETLIKGPSNDKSSEFCFLDYTWSLIYAYGGVAYRFYLKNETGRKFAKNGFRVRTFLENLINDTSPPTVTGIELIESHTLKEIYHIKSTAQTSFQLPLQSKFRVVCMFHDVPAAAIQCKNETITLSTQTDFDRPLSTSDKYVQASLDLPPDLESLSLDFHNLLDNKAVPDMKLRCGDCTISVHKAVLAARSEVFAAMFQNKMLESETGIVDITDLDAPVLELFLKYVYSGKISSVSDDVVPSLYVAGDKYAVHALKKACSERMIARLSEENYLRFLTMADAHSDQGLKDAAVNFVLEHKEVLRSQAWSKFKEEHPRLAVHVMTIFIDKKHFN